MPAHAGRGCLEDLNAKTEKALALIDRTLKNATVNICQGSSVVLLVFLETGESNPLCQFLLFLFLQARVDCS